jgi:hypothetical protein
VITLFAKFRASKPAEPGSAGRKDDMARQVLCSKAGASILPPLEIKTMLDILFIVVTVAFFAISLAYTAACERL